MGLKNEVWQWMLAYQNQILAVLIPLLLLPLPVAAHGDEKAMCAYVMLWMSVNYILRVVPLGVTSLMPLLMFPLLGVLSSKDTASSYISEAVMVQFGTLITGVAFEKVGLHRRLAFVCLKLVGPQPVRLIWTFAFLSFFISMITTNVAAAIAILTIVDAMVSEREAILKTLEETIEEEEANEGEDNTAFEGTEKDTKEELQEQERETDVNHTTVVFKQLNFETNSSNKSPTSYSVEENKVKENDDQWGYALGNSVKFGCTLGGMSTPMGSSLNILILELLAECYEDSLQSSPLTFATWMATLLPVCLVMLCMTCLGIQWYFLGISFKSKSREAESTKTSRLNDLVEEWINKEYEAIGHITYSEVIVAVLFLSLAVLWFFMKPGFMPGWSELSIFKEGYIGSAVPTMMIGMILFILPAKSCICADGNANEGAVETIMDWPAMRRGIPWHLPMLFGAGLASAAASEASGLDIWLGEQVDKLSHLSPGVLLFVLCLMGAFVTELLSSSLMHNLFMPIICNLSVNLGKSPAYLAVPVALCINSNFMMPNQPVNALCLQFNKTTVLQLMATGVFADLLYVCLITTCSLTWYAPILKYDDPFIPFEMNATTAMFQL